MWTELTWPFRWTKYGLQNVWAYFPLIWRDRDWDYCFMLDLWELKFRRMAHLQATYGNGVLAHRYARQLRVAAALCKRISEDKYADFDRERHTAKWGRLKHSTEPTDTPYLRKMVLAYENVRTPEEDNQATDELRRFVKQAEKQRENDLAYLCNLIDRKMLHWWD